jgi:hypothetical protein
MIAVLFISRIGRSLVSAIVGHTDRCSVFKHGRWLFRAADHRRRYCGWLDQTPKKIAY